MVKADGKKIVIVLFLISVAVAALICADERATTATTAAVSTISTPSSTASAAPVATATGPDAVEVSARLVQDKILVGGDGRVFVNLSLQAPRAPETPETSPEKTPGVDLAVVLDRSGSMEGEKIRQAKEAAVRLVESLRPGDRFCMVTYSDVASVDVLPSELTGASRDSVVGRISSVEAGGSTNLGDGLAKGIGALSATRKEGRSVRLLLISDGLANQGVVEPFMLAAMVSEAAQKGISVSTVGLGVEFNEQLMTLLADSGGGAYHYMENPTAFARVFTNEYGKVRSAVASALEIRVPEKEGVRLVEASGYPVFKESDCFVFRPRNLYSEENLPLYLAFEVTPGKEKSVVLPPFQLRYNQGGVPRAAKSTETLSVAFTENEKAVVSSIRRDDWEQKVVTDDYYRLKEQVAEDVKKGQKTEALGRIQAWLDKTGALNETVNSPAVDEKLSKDLPALRQAVEETFQGEAREVEQKQKAGSKAMQYDAYKNRRSQY